MTKLSQEEWSDFACPTGPDTRQPDMVSRKAVLALLGKKIEDANRTLKRHRDSGANATFLICEAMQSIVCAGLIKEVEKL